MIRLVAWASLTALCLSLGTTRAQGGLHALEITNSYSFVGTLAPKTVGQIASDCLTVGCEVLDRDYTDYDEYKTWLPSLGCRKIRLQAGWAKTEKVRGTYDFAWLDHIIDDARSRGLQVWLQTSYGNPVYPGGGTINLGGGMPVSDEAKEGWNRWVEVMAERYKGKVHEWEIWNEPDLSESIPVEEIVDMNIRTAEIIKRADPEARIAGFAFCVLNPELLDECLARVREAGKLDLFHWISYHGYAYRPESSYEGVKAFRAVIDRYDPDIELRQGENGAPSKGHMGGALDAYDWTELSQAKWDLRRLAGDHGHGVESSVFSIIDMAYPAGENRYVAKLNVKGLIESNEHKKVLRPKLAYRAVQHYASLFDHFLKRVDDYALDTDRAEDYAHYLYRNSEGVCSFQIWKQTEAPLNENRVEYKTIRLSGVSFENPVWIDLITGAVFEIPAACVSTKKGILTIEDVPVYDAPIVITDKSTVE